MRIAAWILLGGLLVPTGPLRAQATGAKAPDAAGTSKPMVFDVVSIRENKTAMTTPTMMALVYGPTADGYQAKNLPLMLPLLTAFVPTTGAAFFTPDQITGLPDWAMRERYDIDAKVSEADQTAWQNPAQRAVMLPAMLEAAFADRCKLVAHRETKDSSVQLLEIGKGGPKFKETDPAAEPPPGMKLPSGGGVMVPGAGGVKLYGVTMASLATLLSQLPSIRQTVVDKTGLTGRYDLVMKMSFGTGAEGGPEFSLDDLGLKIHAGKAVVETLVIDHMERPTAN